MIFVDTNYFLRFLLKDSSNQHFQVKKLFLEAAKGNVELVTSLLVFFEIYWVLKSYYEKNKTDLALMLQKLLDLSFIEITEREFLQKSLDLFQTTNLTLEDCYNLVFAKSLEAKDFLTFDLKLAKEWSSLA